MTKILALTMILTTMLGAGLQVDAKRFMETLRDVRLISVAIVANFILVPLFAFAIVRWFGIGSDVGTGIILMAMAPGVPFLVNSGARKQGGSLALALEIAFLFSGLSLITIPITALLLLPPDALRDVPTTSFLTTLVAFQIVPLIIGAVAAPRLSPEVNAKVEKVLHWIFLVAVVGLTIAIFPKIISSFTTIAGLGHLWAIACVGLFSAAVGFLAGGVERAHRRTLTIGTLMRNIGLGMLIATSSFENTLVAPTMIVYFVVTFLISLPIRTYFSKTKDAPARA